MEDIDGERMLQEVFLRELFGENFDRSVGPTYHGSLEPAGFHPVRDTNVRMLSPDDSPQIAVFRLECGEQDWATSGLDDDSRYVAAHFDNEQITSMSGYRPWTDDAGDLCVLAHPAWRGRGHGLRAMSATIDAALIDHKLLLYQTLESNVAATRLAIVLGFEIFATNVAVRLRADAPPSSRQ